MSELFEGLCHDIKQKKLQVAKFLWQVLGRSICSSRKLLILIYYHHRAAELEKEKDELQVIIQRQEKEFASERSKLEDHLLDMNVDLNEQLEARKQLILLQVISLCAN